ncbi:MAG: hypothetical protein ABEJ36_03255 [Candidatus Nanosalina sp.]
MVPGFLGERKQKIEEAAEKDLNKGIDTGFESVRKTERLTAICGFLRRGSIVPHPLESPGKQSNGLRDNTNPDPFDIISFLRTLNIYSLRMFYKQIYSDY